MKKDNRNIIKILLNNEKVNNYTKLMVILNTLDHYEDYYIPNKKLMNMLSINKKSVIRLLHQLECDKVIKVFYKGRKRYFTFIATSDSDENKKYNNNLDDYNWLEEEKVNV